MKKVLMMSVLMLVMQALGGMKIGVADLMLLIRNHPNYDSNKDLLVSTDKDYQKKLDVIKREGEKLQEEGKKLAEQYRNPMLNDSAKGDLEKQLSDIQQKLMGVEQRYRNEALRIRQELQDLEGRLLKATTEDLRKRITKYAEANGFDFIVDKTATPFYKDEYEVTDWLLKEMGVEPKDAKGRDESK